MLKKKSCTEAASCMAGGGEGGGALERVKAARSVREGGRRERPALLSNSEKWTAL